MKPSEMYHIIEYTTKEKLTTLMSPSGDNGDTIIQPTLRKGLKTQSLIFINELNQSTNNPIKQIIQKWNNSYFPNQT